MELIEKEIERAKEVIKNNPKSNFFVLRAFGSHLGNRIVGCCKELKDARSYVKYTCDYETYKIIDSEFNDVRNRIVL